METDSTTHRLDLKLRDEYEGHGERRIDYNGTNLAAVSATLASLLHNYLNGEESDTGYSIGSTLDIVPDICESEELAGMLNPERRSLYDAVVQSIERSRNRGRYPEHVTQVKLFYIDGLGGSGKTFFVLSIAGVRQSEPIVFYRYGNEWDSCAAAGWRANHAFRFQASDSSQPFIDMQYFTKHSSSA